MSATVPKPVTVTAVPVKPAKVDDTAGTVAVTQAARFPHLAAPTAECPFFVPAKRIRSSVELDAFRTTNSYRQLTKFIRSLGDAVLGLKISDPRASDAAGTPQTNAVMQLLENVSKLIEEVEPQPSSQRFGNRAFRTFHYRLVEHSPDWIHELLLKPFMHGEDDKADKLPEAVTFAAAVEISAYLCDSFGNPVRLDYGTGHELHFIVVLYCLFLARVLTMDDAIQVVLRIFNRYLKICRTLQQRYKQEPAGSHGVWSLDDYQFVPYIWGASQLVDHPSIQPGDVLDPILVSKNADDYLYLSCINYTCSVKSGPFFEHSPDLYNISGAASWRKIYNGMLKKYDVDVLSKWPVMQHFLFGSFVPCLWDTAAYAHIAQDQLPSQAECRMPPTSHMPAAAATSAVPECKMPPLPKKN